MNKPPDSAVAPDALRSLRGVETSPSIAGRFATKTLGGFGADVIKIEPPGTGDPCATGAR